MGLLHSNAMTPAPARMLLLGGPLLALLLLGAQTKPLPAGQVVDAAYTSGEKLETLLPDLGEKGGIPIAAGQNSRDRRLFLITQKKTLGRVMGALRRFTPEPGCQAFWFRSGSGSIFDVDIATVREGKKKAVAWLASIRRANADRIDGLRKRAADDLKKPGGRSFREPSAALLSLYNGLPSDLRKGILESRSGVTELSRLSPGARAAVLGYTSLTPAERKSCRVAVAPMGPPDRPRMCILAGPVQPSGAYWMVGDLFNPIVRDSGPPRLPPTRPAPLKRRGPANVQDYPVLRRKVSIPGEQGLTLDRLLRSLCAAADLPLIGEYEPGIHQRQIRKLGLFQSGNESDKPSALNESFDGAPVSDVLERICSFWDLTWDFRDGWIEIRNPRTIGELAGVFDLSPPRTMSASKSD